MLTCYISNHKVKGRIVLEDFAAGAGPGARVVMQLHAAPGPAALWGLNDYLADVWRAIQADGREFYFLDRPYFAHTWPGWVRVTRNAEQLQNIGVGDWERFERLGVPIRPWHKDGRHVVICPPGAEYSRVRGFSDEAWIRDTLEKIEHHTDREIRIRPKPSRYEKKWPLKEDLKDAWALVTYGSAAATEAVLDGVPVFVTGGGAALAVGTDDLCRIERPVCEDNREEWAAWLASNQWTLDELKDGTCWRQLHEGIRA